ncbi:MAG: PrpF protein [Firmicutes bacterium]|nr:PrpF protein [Bacillota bacterium]
MKVVNALFMRGGTTNGIMMHWEDMPANREDWNDFIIKMVGDCDAKFVDGLHTTKILVMKKSERPGVDVDYIAGHILHKRKTVDWGANCGNMTTAVGPYAILEKMVEAKAPMTDVNLFNLNTDKLITEHVAVDPETGTFSNAATVKDAGISHPAGEVIIDFVDPTGSSTDCLLPTGNCIDSYEIPGLGTVEGTLVDACNPTVLFRAQDFGLTGLETPAEIDANEEFKKNIELARQLVSVKAGISKDLEDAWKNHPAEPRIGIFSAPKDFATIDDIPLKAEDMDINIRLMTMEVCHYALAVSSSVAIAVSCCLKGGIVERELGLADPVKGVRVANPSGIITLFPDYDYVDGEMDLHKVGIRRSSRIIMKGCIYIPD